MFKNTPKSKKKFLTKISKNPEYLFLYEKDYNTNRKGFNKNC